MINVSRPENKMGSLPIESSTLRDPSSIVVSTHMPSMKEVFLAQLASQSMPKATTFPAPEFFEHYEQTRSVHPSGRQSDSTKTSTSPTTTSSVVPLASVDTLLPSHRTFLADSHSFNRTSSHSPGVRAPIFNGELCRCGICPDCRNYTSNLTTDFVNDSSAVSPICSTRPANELKIAEQPESKTSATSLLYHLPEHKLPKKTRKETSRLTAAERTVTLLHQPLNGEDYSATATNAARTCDLPHSCNTELLPVSARGETIASPSSDVLFSSTAVHSQSNTTASTKYQNSQFLASAPAAVSILPHPESTNVTTQSYSNVCPSSSTETVVSNISLSPANRPEVSDSVSSTLHTVSVQVKSNGALSPHLPRSVSCHQVATGRFILPSKAADTTREAVDAQPSTTSATAITPQVHLISLTPTSHHGSGYNIPTNTALKTAVPAAGSSTSLLCVNAQMLSSGGASFVLLPIAAASLMQSLSSPSITSQATKVLENSVRERKANTAAAAEPPIDGRGAQLLFLQTAQGKAEQPPRSSCASVDLQSTTESPEVVMQEQQQSGCSSGGLTPPPPPPPPDVLGTTTTNNFVDCPVSAPFASGSSSNSSTSEPPDCTKPPVLPPLSSLSFSHAAATTHGENSALLHYDDRQQTVLPSAAHLLAPKSSSSASSELLASLTTAKPTALVLKPEQSEGSGGGGCGGGSGGFTPRKRHQCPFCAKTCERKDNLQAHIRTHTGERPYPCRFCPKAFPQKDHLRAHIRTHTGEKPYHCVQCLKAFAQLGNLHRHVKTHRR